MSAIGGLTHKATFFKKRLASLLANKWSDDHAFSCDGLVKMFFVVLSHSTIQCIRRACSSIGHYVFAPPCMDLVRVESSMTIY